MPCAPLESFERVQPLFTSCLEGAFPETRVLLPEILGHQTVPFYAGPRDYSTHVQAVASP